MIARVLVRRGQVREELADYLGASGDHQRALHLARTVGDSELEALALARKKALLERYDVHFYRAGTNTTLSWVWRELGELGRGRELAEEAVEQSRQVDGRPPQDSAEHFVGQGRLTFLLRR